MSKNLSQIMERVKNQNTKEAKTEFVNAVTKETFIVPMLAKTEKNENGKETVTEISHFSISSEGNSYLMIFTSVDEISKWRKDIQFIELGFLDILSLVENKNANYSGVVIDHCTANMAVSKNFLEKLRKQ